MVGGSFIIGQVAIFVIGFFLMLFKKIPEKLWSSTKFFLSYDNVCNLANMKIWREPLPLKNLSNMWSDNIVKIIDSVHLHNHKHESCKILYNPAILKKNMPDANTMICEETFAWLLRYKKILNSLPKNRFEFMLHRLVIHRNHYTEYCYKVKKYPLLPSMKVKK